MGYLHIDNLYKNQDILLFKQCYALEKVHGTSAHVGWREGLLTLSGGGEAERFPSIFDIPALTEKLAAAGREHITIYGEAYGGRCQGMRDSYGNDLRFIVFDIKIGESWINVP